MITANREQLKVIQRLTLIDEKIASKDSKREADKLANFAIDLYNVDVMQAFSNKDYLFRSLGSYLLKQNPKTGAVSQRRFGELLHAGSAVGIGYLSTVRDGIRALSLQVDAAAIARPPADETALEAFYEKVNLPIKSIVEIRAVE
ncbi:hypothetical protein KC874_05150 [Candidatus Saccharibacteria bacterium]|nr:hypothetical protein [Candidatus Saccharibacteria bacterium]